MRALEAEGFTVWWDRGVAGGEEWRRSIGNALDAARCVIVLWTRASVGDSGEFVRDEASRARQRNILVPVLLENVVPPLGFGETQTIDLQHWRGARRDPFFRDLVAAVLAKLDGAPAPAAKGPTIRLYRRVTSVATLSAIIATLFGFGFNLLGVQNQVCAIPSANLVSDVCGALGLGDRPRREERLAWESRPAGDCDALRTLAARQGYYQGVAADMLEAATTERAPDYTPAPREWRSYVRTSELPFATEAAAKADVLGRAEVDAVEQGCAPRAAFDRLIGVNITPQRYDCRQDPSGGSRCALDYVALCRVETRVQVERCG
jgi:hypothetical protein